MKRNRRLLLIAGVVFLAVFFLNEFPVIQSLAEFLFSLLLIILGISLLSIVFKKNRANQSKKHLPSLSKNRETRYLEAGMTPSEIDFFRETMHQTKQEIEHLQENLGQNAKLRAIDLRHQTTRAAQALFKELVKSPTRLSEASQFLYTHLPNMVDLTDKYLEIDAHEIKSRETYGKLEESIQIINQMALLIVQDYQKFVSDDLDDLEIELSIAKQQLQQQQDHSF